MVGETGFGALNFHSQEDRRIQAQRGRAIFISSSVRCPKIDAHLEKRHFGPRRSEEGFQAPREAFSPLRPLSCSCFKKESQIYLPRITGRKPIRSFRRHPEMPTTEVEGLPVRLRSKPGSPWLHPWPGRRLCLSRGTPRNWRRCWEDVGGRPGGGCSGEGMARGQAG